MMRTPVPVFLRGDSLSTESYRTISGAIYDLFNVNKNLYLSPFRPVNYLLPFLNSGRVLKIQIPLVQLSLSP